MNNDGRWSASQAMQESERKMDMDKLLLTVPEAATRLGIGRTKLYELIAGGKLRTVRIGRAVRIPASSVIAYVENLQRDCRPEVS